MKQNILPRYLETIIGWVKIFFTKNCAKSCQLHFSLGYAGITKNVRKPSDWES